MSISNVTGLQHMLVGESGERERERGEREREGRERERESGKRKSVFRELLRWETEFMEGFYILAEYPSEISYTRIDTSKIRE